MKLAAPFSTSLKIIFRIVINFRRLLPRTRSESFGLQNANNRQRIEHIYIINLDRQRARWKEMEKELRSIFDYSGNELWDISERYKAIDANNFSEEPQQDQYVNPIYTLGEQLFVEPQPLTLPTRMDLDTPIQMSRPETAIACSHIDVWRKVAKGVHKYALVLEDDVWFRSGFAKNLDQAWNEITNEDGQEGTFDILYLSFEEVKHGAPKTFLSKNIFHPMRGLWGLSGYVISCEGAKKLLKLLPCKGPVDLWINHQFGFLDVRAIRRPVISQRPDVSSTNSYSILPSLTKIGAINSESASLFHIRPKEQPVFAFGMEDSGLTSLAMALSMLGYRCCSDLQALPKFEYNMLITRKGDRVFNAYVNIGSLSGKIQILKERYPHAKFIITSKSSDGLKILDDLDGADVAILPFEALNKWQIICEFLKSSPPPYPFPEIADLGQSQLVLENDGNVTVKCKYHKRDNSPWVVEAHKTWQGIHSVPARKSPTDTITVNLNDNFESLKSENWLLRDDTFTDNLALFRPSNIKFCSELGAELSIKKESLGVREYSAASITSCDHYLFGKFEAKIKASKAPGVVTGFFLHRNSPRQEIDIEITGNRPNRLLINVFYNPGAEGAKFDYGYRGSACDIDLGFDASEDYHLYTIEWEPSEIRWFVDSRLVHRRVNWNPTPIPQLPMTLHLNIWPTRSKELAGRLNNRNFPTTTYIKSIALNSNRHRSNKSI